jgi:site-specific DNA-methyltransferase (adenine-specific)
MRAQAETREAPTNTLYYGDNLEVLRRYIADESLDLVYLDPPFNSAQDYNVLFQARDGHAAEAQIRAFEDTWRWDRGAEGQYREIVERGGRVSEVLQAFRLFLGTNDMLAYLTMMAPRLVELHRVLKPTGSLYLHCDPTASHYLKLLLDAVFGPTLFRNEIVWERTSSHNFRTSGYVRANDVLLFYTKSDDFTFNTQYAPYGETQLRRYKKDSKGRLYKAENLTFSTANPTRQFEWRGTKPPPHRSWGASKEQLEAWLAEGRILLKRDGTPRLDGLKVFLDDTKGKPISTNWADIQRIGNTSDERLGYPTQKPEALLDRIIQASSHPGDLVLDPFCGCGTTIASAQRLGRRWIGIDITHLAIGLIRNRLADAHGASLTYHVVGEPVTLDDAEALAAEDKFQFQAWALGLVGARPAQGVKKGADKGIDGTLYFHSSEGSGKTDRIILSVKGGKLKADDVRALEGVRAREKAAIGVLISFDEPSKKMRTDAASLGFHDTAWGAFPRIQLLTVKELLEGKRIEYPRITEGNKTFKRAPKAKGAADAQQIGFLDE